MSFEEGVPPHTLHLEVLELFATSAYRALLIVTLSWNPLIRVCATLSVLLQQFAFFQLSGQLRCCLPTNSC